mgnify:CR=1 FL=1
MDSKIFYQSKANLINQRIEIIQDSGIIATIKLSGLGIHKYSWRIS